MKLSIKKGQEGHIVVSTNIFDENIYAYSAYKKAGQALSDFISRSKELRRTALSPGPSRTGAAEALYLFGQNIIAFSGHRGQGKTSAMLSMCSALKNTEELSGLEKGEITADIKDCRFSILQPIDPTCLENSQDILSLILSRMYRYVLDIFEHREAGRHTRDGFERYSEFQKNELFIKFQSCLSSINAAKGKGQGKGIENMSMLDDYSDGAVLKQKFFELVDLILDLEYGERNCENHFMVIQLDDTDFQIARGYEIMEDIRKYLTLPNIIIFMATDISLLRKGIIQHYLKDFETNIKHLDDKNSNGSAPNGNGVVNEIREIGGKYLAKLIPPAYIAHLPRLDELIRDNTENIELEYVDEKNEDLLPRGTGTGYSFQSSILRYIYQKTHIVFIAPERYMHNIIPTTLRGLVQLLKLLSDMKDVPEISDTDMSDTELSGENALVAALKEQIPIQQRNIQLFEDYFLNDWVPAKLTPADQAKIARLCDTVPKKYTRLIPELIHLKKPATTKLKKQEKTDDAQDCNLDQSLENDKNVENANLPYAYTIECIESERNRCCSQSDFYYCYAICTYLTLQYNKIALREKLNAVRTYGGSVFVVDYDPRENNLPTSYCISNKALGAGKVSNDFDDFLGLCKGDDGSAKNAIRFIGKGTPAENIFNFLLRLGHFYKYQNNENKADIIEFSGSDIQKTMFEAQESALCIATNWDVQHQLYEILSKQQECEWETFKIIIDEIQTQLAKSNNGDKQKPMVSAMKNEHIIDSLKKIYLKNALDKDLLTIIKESFEASQASNDLTDDEKISILEKIVRKLEENKDRKWSDILNPDEVKGLKSVDDNFSKNIDEISKRAYDQQNITPDPKKNILDQHNKDTIDYLKTLLTQLKPKEMS